MERFTYQQILIDSYIEKTLSDFKNSLMKVPERHPISSF